MPTNAELARWLADKVMGYPLIDNTGGTYPHRYSKITDDGCVLCESGYGAVRAWSPAESVADAIEAAEAWRAVDTGRWWELDVNAAKYECAEPFNVSLNNAGTVLSTVAEETLELAISLALYAATGGKP